jgi:hypothetical protein
MEIRDEARLSEFYFIKSSSSASSCKMPSQSGEAYRILIGLILASNDVGDQSLKLSASVLCA